MSRVLVLGLDSVTPELLFGPWRAQLPTLDQLMRRGAFGPLRSCIPPITVPAWSCMLSSKDPGQLGIYGFRNRATYSYDGLALASSRDVRHDRVWDILARDGKRSVVIGVPGTYPPPSIDGALIADFLTPSPEACYTSPASLAAEVRKVAPQYRFDVTEFRTEDKQRVLDDIHAMTSDRFRVARHLLDTAAWDFFMLHEIGPDRIHHGFWAAMDPQHPKHVRDNSFQTSILDYYRHLDREIGALLESVPVDTHVLVVSDHGAQRMKGGVCINEWLIQHGYLTLTERPMQPVPIARAHVDWARTLAWGEGGYYARIFFNVEGREPEGALPARDYDRFAEQLRSELRDLPDHLGASMATEVYQPRELYRSVSRIAPDLTVLFDNLAWRSVGTIGDGSLYTFDNDTGPDDANHAMDGIVIFTPGDGQFAGGTIFGASLYDVAPTILDLLGVVPPEDMIGSNLHSRIQEHRVA